MYELVKPEDPILKQKLPNFDFMNPPADPIQLAKDLAETMLKYNGLGLAANQVGLPHRVFVIAANPILACFNPKIVDYAVETEYLDEGCLTFPGLFIKIKRPNAIKVRYTEPNGNIVTTKFQGMTCRIFQHELDHLDGVIYTSRANPYHLEKAKKLQQKIVSTQKKLKAG